MRYRLPGFIFVLIFALHAFLLAHDVGKNKVTLQLRWFHQYQFAGYYAAKELGFYKDAGLDVDIVEGGINTDVMSEVISGKADFGVQTPSIALDRSKGKPVVVLAAIFQHSPVALIVDKKSGIRSPSMLAGKRIMLGKKNVEIRAMLISEMVIDKVEIIEFTGDYRDLFNGTVDGASGYVTDLSYINDQNENTFDYIRPVTYGIDFYGDCLFTSEDMMYTETETVLAFREASLKGWKFAMENPEKMIDIIISDYKSSLSREKLFYEYSQIQKLMHTDIVEIGHINPARWKHIVEIFQRIGLIDDGFKIKNFLYTDYIGKNSSVVRTLLSITSLVLLILLAALWRNYRKGKAKEILEEARYKKEIESLKARFEYVLGATKTGFDIIDEDYNVIYVDPEWIKKLGDYRGKKCFEYFMGTKKICPGCAIPEAIETGKTTISEEYLEKENRYVEVHTIALNEDLNGKRLVAEFNIDITERKNIEKKLRKFNAELEKKVDERTAQLANTNTELESFSYSVSHDLRAPVRHIIGFTDIFIKENQDILSEKSKDLFSKITYSAHKMEKLIDDLLNLSRTGRREIVSRKVDMKQIIENLIEEYKECKEQKRVKIHIGEMPEVCADMNLLTVVWENLIDNACKYTNGQDPVKIDISCKDERSEYVYCIKDNGVGFDPQFKHKLFGVFQRLHLEKDFPGTGIGLANVRRIISRHGGRTWAESEGEGKGASFYFSLPKNPGEIK